MSCAEQILVILDTHHAFEKAELQRLGAAIAEMDATPRLTAPFAHLRNFLESHMMKEEQVLFPSIQALESGQFVDISCMIAGMRHEHDELSTYEVALRSAARDAGPLEDDILAFLDDLVEHARKEEEELFPAALAMYEARANGTPVAADAPASPSPGASYTVARRTQGRCEQCVEPVPAELRVYEDRVDLVKLCPDHGETVQLMSKSPEYWAELDEYYFRVNSENYPQRDYIVRMTESCNLDCPICLAKANTEETPDLDLSGLEKLLSERRGIKVDLMAAEPTLRADLEDWIRKVKASGNIAALHTNGLKLANKAYAKKIADAGVDEVFLQFDGFDDDANEALRGQRLLKARMKAIDNLRDLGVSTSLIVVIARGLNEDQVGETFRFALRPENTHIKEVFYLGLRMLGSLRDSARAEGNPLADSTLMPDEIIDMLTEQEAPIRRDDVRAFNKLYFAMLSALKVKKCLYVQHYLVIRDDKGGYRPVSDLMDMASMESAAERYADRVDNNHPFMAKAGLLKELSKQGLRPAMWPLLKDFVQLERLMENGMNLAEVPQRMLLLGFITACDPHNFDADVAINCGKGELSVDGGFIESGAVANVNREARFDSTDKRPGERGRKRD
jgi:uncharacterized radical SAM superfamily Fe-S cluster-containing enzyme/hemerythrin superfamily protein